MGRKVWSVSADDTSSTALPSEASQKAEEHLFSLELSVTSFIGCIYVLSYSITV